jgi:hypothetical protein
MGVSDELAVIESAWAEVIVALAVIGVSAELAVSERACPAVIVALADTAESEAAPDTVRT